MKLAVIAMLAILVLAGCSQQQNQQQATQAQPSTNTDSAQAAAQQTGGALTVAKGDTIKAEYIGKFTDGTVFDQSAGRGPLQFTVGGGQMIQGFDEAVVGMKLNDEKTVTIPPEKAYGSADAPGQTVTVPVSSISGDGNVTVGSQIQARTGQIGTVTSIDSGKATLEFRHPLAGKTLVFWIKVVDIQKAK